MKLNTYLVGQGDTIETLARVLLGSTDKSDQLIQLNKLRYPYISDDPMDQFASRKGQVYLTASYTDPTAIIVSNPNSLIIQANDSIVLSEGSSFGSAVINSVNGLTVSFTSAISGAYDSGALAYIYSNQQNVSTNVLRTGDVLLYPFDANSNTSVADNYSLILGTDLKLDANRFLVRDGNDIAVVSGLDNLGQALTLRYNSELGSLNMHEDYGNGQYQILGEASTSYFIGLAKHHAQQCGLQDPRVQTVTVVDFGVQEDKFLVTLSIVPIGSQDPITQTISVKIGGAG